MKHEYKYDEGKLRYDLIPPTTLRELAKVLTHGAKKYGDNNWRKVKPFSERYYSALMRHLEAWRMGEEIDEESGEDKLKHLAQVICNAMFLLVGEEKESD